MRKLLLETTCENGASMAHTSVFYVVLHKCLYLTFLRLSFSKICLEGDSARDKPQGDFALFNAPRV
jgi:hypothetical protein